MISDQSRFGKYVLLNRLPGAGAIESYLAKSEVDPDGERVQLKRIPVEALAGDENVAAFLAQAKIHQGLRHPNIATVLDFGVEGGYCFVATQHVDGATLKHLLRRLRDAGTRMPAGLAVAIIVKACAGLKNALGAQPETGKGMIHRDLGLNAILVGTKGEVKLQGFSGSEPPSVIPHTSGGTVLHRFVYQSPEQVRGKPSDPRSNVFSLGVCLYEMLTGENPFDRLSPMESLRAVAREAVRPLCELRPDLVVLDPIISHALAKNPDDRYADAGALGSELSRILQTEGLPGSQLELGEFVAHALGKSTAPAKDWEDNGTSQVDVDTDTFGGTFALDPPGTRSEATVVTPSPLLEDRALEPPKPQRDPLWSLLCVAAWAFLATLTFALGQELLRSRFARAGGEPVVANEATLPAAEPTSRPLSPSPPPAAMASGGTATPIPSPAQGYPSPEPASAEPIEPAPPVVPVASPTAASERASVASAAPDVKPSVAPVASATPLATPAPSPAPSVPSPAPATRPDPKVSLPPAPPPPSPPPPKRTFGTLRITGDPILPIFADGRRQRRSLILTERSGEVQVGSKRHIFTVSVRYRVKSGRIAFDLESTPWAMVFDKKGLAVGKTPIKNLTGVRASGLRLVNPAQGKEMRLTISFKP